MPVPDPTAHVEAVALFRYGLIADLLHLRPGDRSLHTRLREKATRDYEIPGTTRRRVAAETLRDWLYAYRRGGFDGAQAAAARRSGPRARPAAGRGRSALRAQGAAPRLQRRVGDQHGAHPRPDPRGPADRARHRPPVAEPPRPDGAPARGADQQGPAPLQLRGRQRALDGRRHARARPCSTRRTGAATRRT